MTIKLKIIRNCQVKYSNLVPRTTERQTRFERVIQTLLSKPRLYVWLENVALQNVIKVPTEISWNNFLYFVGFNLELP